MSRSPFRTREFKELQDHWYEKLKSEGFEDIEEIKLSSELLKQWHCSYFHKRFNIEQLTYYSLASEVLNRHEFTSEVVKAVWELHSEGLTIREISKKLNLKIWFVHRTIKGLSELILKRKQND